MTEHGLGTRNATVCKQLTHDQLKIRSVGAGQPGLKRKEQINSHEKKHSHEKKTPKDCRCQQPDVTPIPTPK